MYTRASLADDLRALGLRRGDSVIVHSSCKRIGLVDGGAFAVIEALIEVLLPEGALLFPNLYIPHEFTVANPPRFDLKHESVRLIGIIPDLFKTHYAQHFSLHPTHSVMGIGARAPALLADHERAGVPCGDGTPWTKSARAGGRVLLIGCTQRCNTTYHAAEEMVENSYQLSADVINGIVVVDGREIVVPSRLHRWGNHPDFSKLNPELRELGLLHEGKVGDADTLCIEAGGFLDLALAKMQVNRDYFLAK